MGQQSQSFCTPIASCERLPTVARFTRSYSSVYLLQLSRIEREDPLGFSTYAKELELGVASYLDKDPRVYARPHAHACVHLAVL